MTLQAWHDTELDIQRSAVLRGAIDALAANVPSLRRLLGGEAFDEIAAAFVRAQLPRRGGLLRYGAGPPESPASTAALAEHDYLPGVAALDLAWIESHPAPDARVLTTADVFALTGRLVPHPATRWLTFEVPAFTIWRRQRAIDVGEAEFLAACAARQSCDDALESVLVGGSGFDLAVSLPRLLRAGAFTRIDGDAA